MNISQTIEALEKIKERHGDLEVACWFYQDGWDELYTVLQNTMKGLAVCQWVVKNL